MMMRKLLFAVVIAACGAFRPAIALTADGNSGVTTSIGTINDHILNAGSSWGSFEWIDACGYYACGDNGGGLLHRELGLVADNCIIFADSKGNTFRRVSVRGLGEECGLTKGSIYDAGVSGESAQGAVTRINAAVAAFQSVGINTLQLNINTMWGQNFTVSDQFVIDCGVPVGFVQSSANYTLTGGVKGIIAHPPAVTFTYPAGGQSGGFRHCIVERSGDAFAPTVFVPSGTRDSMNLANAFAGDGFSIHSEAAVLDDVMILGFDRCIDISKVTKAAKRMAMHNITGDCGSHVGYPAFSIKDVPSGGYFENLRTNSYLSKTDADDASTSEWDIDNIIDDGTGQCKIVASVDSGTFTIIAGDPIWVGLGNNHGAQSCTGKWTAGTVTNKANGDPDGCVTLAGCQEVILTGSQFTATTGSGTWASGSNLVTLAVSPTQLATGQAVTSSTGCVPANTFGGDIMAEDTPDWHQGFLVQSDRTTPQVTTCAGVAANIVFTNGAYAKVAGVTTVLESAIWRAGDGIYMENDGGITINRCQSYNHQNAVHLYGSDPGLGGGNTQLGLLEACSVGTADPLPDDSTCGLLADGDVSTHDASDYTILGGIWGQHLASAFCINSDSDNAMKIVGPSVGPSAGKRWGSMFKIRRGNVTVSGPQAHGKGNIWVGTGATFNMSGAYLPQGQIYTQDGTAVINGCGNTLQYEELNGKLYTARECIGVLNAGFMPSYTISGTLQTGQHMVFGTVALFAGAATINLTGQAVFSSTNYTCSLTDVTAANPTKLTRTSGTQFGITGTGTDSIDYRCIGPG